MVISCEKCPETGEMPLKPNDFNPLVYRQHFVRLDWDIWSRGKRVLCPKCSGKKPKEPKVEPATTSAEFNPAFAALANFKFDSEPETIPQEETMSQTNGHHAEPATSTIVVPVLAAPPPPLKTSEKMMLAETYLDGHYLKGVCCYRPGASDEQGAEQCQMTLAQFKALRESDYGPLLDYSKVLAEVGNMEINLSRSITDLTALADAVQQTLRAANGPLPKQLEDFLKVKRNEVEVFAAEWRRKSERSITTFERESENTLAGVETQMRELWADVCNAESAKIQESSRKITEKLETLGSLDKQLKSIRAKLPSATMAA